MNRKVCVLCHRSEETEVTGSLCTDEDVMAHQKCLIYSAGIICQDTPEFSDLYGFRAADVWKEVNRGKKLVCCRCRRRGATVGCEVKRCQKSYHYPCAIEDKAKPVDSEDEGRYVIYCFRHYLKRNDVSAKRKDSSVSESSDSGASGGPLPKRILSDSDAELDSSPSKRKTVQLLQLSDDSVDAEDTGANADMDIFAPLDSDVEDNENSQESAVLQIRRKVAVLSESGDEQEDERPDKNREEDKIIDSSLEAEETEEDDATQRVRLCMDSPQQEFAEPSPNQSQSTLLEEAAESGADDVHPVISVQHQSSFQKERTISPISDFNKPDPPRSFPTSPPTAAPPPSVSRPAPSSGRSSRLEPRFDSSSFWKSCNAAGCTQALFDDFHQEMIDVSQRIRTDQASDADYDLALSVMEASGKLAAYVAKQQEELQRKQQELKEASAALTEAVSTLKKRPSAAGSTA